MNDELITESLQESVKNGRPWAVKPKIIFAQIACSTDDSEAVLEYERKETPPFYCTWAVPILVDAHYTLPETFQDVVPLNNLTGIAYFSQL